MAAAILSHLAGHKLRVASGGVRAGDADPYVAVVMDEIGIDLTEHEPQPLSAIGDATFDLIVTLSPEAHHNAVELTRIMAADVEYWPTVDATVGQDCETRKEKLTRYRRVRDELFSRIKKRFDLEGGPAV